MLIKKLHIVLLFCQLFYLQAGGQDTGGRLTAFLKSDGFASLQLKYSKEVAAFYTLNGYQYSWAGAENSARLHWLAGVILHADSVGLLSADYHPDLFEAYASPHFVLQQPQDTLVAETRFTDAAIHFMHDVMAGNREEPLAFNGLQNSPGCIDIPPILNSFLQNNRYGQLLQFIEPKTDAYQQVKKRLNEFRVIASGPGFRDAVVLSSRPDTSNHALIKRLHQLGCLGADTVPLPSLLKAQLQQAQQMLSVLHDGVLRSTTLEVLNQPLQQRIEALKGALNALRWLECIKKHGHVIVVNIPSASLLLYEEGRVVLESRVIVGKKSTPTPTLASTITDLVLYPYWNVPEKIARRELLPLIKRNRAYLSMNNFQVLNLQGRVVDPKKVNWSAMNAGNFPYRLRQSTGCDNSLGLIKLNFYSPFGVYLHDTPWKILFGFNRRYLSHGCMRLEKTKEVARYVAGSNNTIAVDSISDENCLKNQAPVTVAASEKIPVIVVYHTAWPDAAAVVRFYEDPYNKFPASGTALTR